jgi:hypothetical protein
VVLQVGASVFVHGGVLPQHAAYGVARINSETRAWLAGDAPRMPGFLNGRHAVVWSRDYSTGVRPSTCSAPAQSHYRVLTRGLPRVMPCDGLWLRAADGNDLVITETQGPRGCIIRHLKLRGQVVSIFEAMSCQWEGVCWRLHALCMATERLRPRARAEDEARCDCGALAQALGMLPGAARMVVGHTIQDAGINAACGDRVFRIDVGLSKGCGNGEPEVRLTAFCRRMHCCTREAPARTGHDSQAVHTGTCRGPGLCLWECLGEQVLMTCFMRRC